MENETMLPEEEVSILTLTDENGNEVNFEYLDSIEYQGVEYLVLAPEGDEEGGDADIVLFGHTHEMLERRLTPDKYPSLSKPLYVFNPGAISGYKSSFGCLDITLRGEIMLSHGEL